MRLVRVCFKPNASVLAQLKGDGTTVLSADKLLDQVAPTELQACLLGEPNDPRLVDDLTGADHSEVFVLGNTCVVYIKQADSR